MGLRNKASGDCLSLISGIALCHPQDEGYWQAMLTRLVMELDEQDNIPALADTRALLREQWGLLETDPARARPLAEAGDPAGDYYKPRRRNPVAAAEPRVPEPPACPQSERAEGGHAWHFDGDDPYIECSWCGRYQDALTGQVIRPGREHPAEEQQ